MEIIAFMLRLLIWLVAGAAALELLAALFSIRVRRYIARYPILHCVGFACSLVLVLFLVPVRSHRHDDMEYERLGRNLEEAIGHPLSEDEARSFVTVAHVIRFVHERAVD